MLVLQKGLILPVPMYGGSYFFIQPRICERCELCKMTKTVSKSFGSPSYFSLYEILTRNTM